MNRLSIVLLSALALMALSSLARAQDAFADTADPKITLPGLTEYAPASEAGDSAAIRRSVRMQAALTEDGDPLNYGLTWRVFHPAPGPDGKLPLLATSEGGSAEFEFEPGDYFLHVAFGRAGVTKKLTIPKDGPIETQHIVMEAGGLMLNAVSGIDARIPSSQLVFNIYKAEEGIDGEQQLVVENVKPNTIVRLNSGTYHIISEYGSVNAVIRSDIRVEAGKLTEAVIQHRAAQLTLKLVSEPGGEAIADTAWSILTSGGDVVSESVGAFPTIVLAEGEYTAIARNKNKVHQRDFTVIAGRNSDVEVLLN
ncbi:hypothetical protein SAMN05877838_0033 [Hoeflea halophila]|uniref:Uncharacterized protein n=1 Tax=Hoeflea halophila TaxID=714899 RepID=A0A286HKM9_9HYPH|nr:hypothetical protein [Hoeflea halophila]SOE08322.1 hypothetical protein SAMN05877838_0033 [Hoeflea halophila]